MRTRIEQFEMSAWNRCRPSSPVTLLLVGVTIMRRPPSSRSRMSRLARAALRNGNQTSDPPQLCFCFWIRPLILDQVEKFDNRSIWKLIVLKSRTIKMDELAGIRMFVRVVEGVVEGGSFVAAARGL